MSSWKAWLEGRGVGPPQGKGGREETNADAAPWVDKRAPMGGVPTITRQAPATTGAFTLRGIPEKLNLPIISYT